MGAPILEKAQAQHEGCCEALLRCGLTLTRLQPLLRHPDSTFVEDTAVLTDRCAIIARPGAACRRGEVASIRHALSRWYPSVHEVVPPGTLDGGDVCLVGNQFFIGVSDRTNEEGARQLARVLAHEKYVSTCIDIRGVSGILHLKSGLAHLGDNRLAAIGAIADCEALRQYEIVRVEPAENYAANCVRVNDHALLAAAYPLLEGALRALGYSVITLDMSEFRKMDGGLSCLSLRF
jgi:dimethylargininase